MSASITAAPARSSFGRIPAALAALALVVVLAVTVALVAMNGTKAAPITTSPKGAPPPAVIDHSSSSGEKMVNPIWAPSLIPSYGGFGGPRLTSPSSDGARNTGPRLRPN
jgi:hypothetical protein